jgi:hypothetical protein
LKIVFHIKNKRTRRKDTKKSHQNPTSGSQNINNYQYTLALLDGIEEQRILSIIEKNFRNIVENHTRKMQEAKRICWKSIAKIKWAKLGDENTKYFTQLQLSNIEETLSPL